MGLLWVGKLAPGAANSWIYLERQEVQVGKNLSRVKICKTPDFFRVRQLPSRRPESHEVAGEDTANLTTVCGIRMTPCFAREIIRYRLGTWSSETVVCSMVSSLSPKIESSVL